MNKQNKTGGGLQALLAECPMLLSIVISAFLFTLMMLCFRGCSAQENENTPNPDPSLSSQSQLNPEGTKTPGQTQASSDPAQTLPASSTDGAPASTGSAQSSDPETTSSGDPLPPPATDAPATEAPQTEAPVTEAPEPVYPAGFTTVDESYFSDALFIGDSRTDGLNLYCPVGDAKHYSGTSMTIFKIMETTDTAYGFYGVRGLLQGMQFGKIYIMFGINEAGYDTDAFAAQYRRVVEEIRSYQPNAIIYIQSILYVTQNHEAKNPVFATKGLQEKNAKLKELANGTDIFYLEVNDALNDGTDHLPSEYTGDGVHLKAKYYQLWKDYLLEHAIVNAAHPWTPSTSSSQN